MREWPKAWKGEEPTSSALDSGLHASFGGRRQGELVFVDAVSGAQQTVLHGFFRELRLSPDGRHVAFFRQVDVSRPKASRKLERAAPERHRLGIVTTDGELVADAVHEIDEPLSTSLRWSADSAEVALIGRGAEEAGGSLRVFRYCPAGGGVEAVTDARLEPASVLWTTDRRILTLATPVKDSTQAGTERGDWWLVGADQRPRKLSADLSCVPPQLFAEEGREAFVGLADGDIWRLSVADGHWTNLTAGFGPRITQLVWPASTVSDGRSFAQLVVTVDGRTSTGWHCLDLRSGELSHLPWPAPRGWLLDFDLEHAIAIPVAIDRTGSRLWLSKPAFEEHRPVTEVNTWLCDIAEGEIRRVDYRGLDGEDLTAWLILPVDHEHGRRHALIAWVYPGMVYAGKTPPLSVLSIASHHALDVQLLAARGYAVLLPSMPLKAEGEPSDPYLELTKGVLPALDKVIELGVADPDRLGLMGQSYGGYGTYGLITQTSRFRAAVALAGIADLTSLYGQFDPRLRYDDYPHEDLFQMSLAETGQIRMGAPPWRDPQRYLRNSPLFYADRVETPLLIIQGDTDYVPLQQGEQFFTALYRQAKRARLVRYWGEGHVFQNPANVRHMWDEIYGWLHEFLKAPA